MRRDLYEDLYNLEDKHWWHLAKRKICIGFIQKYSSKINSKNILDVGCGTGKNLETLNRSGNTYGVDISSDAIAYCKKRGLKNVYKIRDKLPFKSLYFDTVLSLDVLEHTDEDKFLKEISRVMKMNSVLIVTVPAFSFLWSDWDKVLHHRRRYTSKSLSVALERNSLKILKISYMYSFLIIPVFLIRYLKSKIYKQYPSDFLLSSGPLNYLLYFVSSLESFFIKTVGIPFGTSLICVAKKA